MEFIDSLLRVENGIWALVIIVVVREYFHSQKDKTGPSWVRNGAMDHILDSWTLRFQSVLEKQQSSFRDLPAKNHKLLVDQGELLQRGVDRQGTYLKSLPEMVSQMRECSAHLETQTKVLKAVARELNNTRACPYRPADADAIAKELKRKRESDAHTRAEDLGINLET